ncbi:cell division site-positioning protein MapZ [Streptococcus oralis]|uniref:Mid-cell-anchored protein Z n=1 Tax=Streptococcus oralis subsp. oralis TaxID=1891914 RepID=A0A0F2DGW5_STROR|nr:cell division site-positioning protein MapZ family protein [Streptococcus oralis]KEQ44214.1 holliday junction-specific endonuclease [Streptococcus oralis]KJQ66745.1 putative membrane protein [Streptococcus oralis subsp. oralis]KJQ70123.1 putative membrane protein [Streptococcus oralis subsp. oralis]MBZ2077932.1 Holliday junction resolvase [Streptococcus oralis]
MSKKRRDRHKKGHQEPQFDFDEAKDLTVGQVIRKNEEVEAGVLPEDSILDKYIKQHREEIEADKFETRQLKKEELASTQNLEEMIQEVRESSESSDQVDDSDLVSEESIEEIENEETTQFVPPLQDEESAEIEPLVLTETEPKQINEEQEEETYTPLSRSAQTEPETGSKKKGVIIIASVVAAILVLAGTYYVYRQVSRSNQEIQASQSSSSNQESQTDLQEFNTLYDAFYTDENKTALKNSQFDKLSQLKTLLDKLEGSRNHTLAKSKYDSLATQIKAIQDINALFESPAITDGVLDTNAKAKADAKFTEIKTGNTELDKLLDKAISLGKSQQTSASSSSSSQASSSSATESNASSTTPSTSTTAPARDTNGGLSSDGVNLQRSASRVPYNQTAVDDSNNPAWTFADGVLEQILATSRARGYITGNQYILERVNIVNGNGYYNLYKPDGTYLFTLNCKTGYFVGNGSGHADDLDY